MTKLKKLFYLQLLYWKISFESNLDILVCPLNGAQGVAKIAKTLYFKITLHELSLLTSIDQLWKSIFQWAEVHVFCNQDVFKCLRTNT